MPISSGSSGITGAVISLAVENDSAHLDPGASDVPYTLEGPGITGTLQLTLGSQLIAPDGGVAFELVGIIDTGTAVDGSGTYTLAGGVLLAPMAISAGTLTVAGSVITLDGTFAAGNPGVASYALFNVTSINLTGTLGLPAALAATPGEEVGTYTYTIPPGAIAATYNITAVVGYPNMAPQSLALSSVVFATPGYCTADDVKAATSRWSSYTDQSEARVNNAIMRASAIIDDQTGQWFDLRHLQVKTQPHTSTQRKLFMPAPVVTIDSITESGATLDASTQILIYGSWLEKVTPTPPALISASFNWAVGQQNVVVSGYFGYSTVPLDIVQACAHIAGMILGMVERSYVTGDGSAGAALVNSFPPWVKEILTRRTRTQLQYQPFILTAL